MVSGTDLTTWNLLVCFLYGSSLGSFSTVVWSRWRRGESILHPRSHCGACNHPLGLLDLFPVISFIFLRGRCRFCRTRIPWQYPMVELGAGGLALISYITGGWLLAGAAMLVWLAVAGGLTLFHRFSRSEAGFSLVESLISVMLVSLVLVPVLEAVTFARNAGTAAQRGTLMVGLAQGRIQKLKSLATIGGLAKLDDPNSPERQDEDVLVTTGAGTETYHITSPLVALSSIPLFASTDANAHLRAFTVTVSCTNCKGRLGQPAHPITLTTVVYGR